MAKSHYHRKLESIVVSPVALMYTKLTSAPFELVKQYMKIRGNYDNFEEPFFVLGGKLPVTTNHVRQVLKLTLVRIGLDESLYDTHSLRIGRTSDLIHWGKKYRVWEDGGVMWCSNTSEIYKNFFDILGRILAYDDIWFLGDCFLTRSTTTVERFFKLILDQGDIKQAASPQKASGSTGCLSMKPSSFGEHGKYKNKIYSAVWEWS